MKGSITYITAEEFQDAFLSTPNKTIRPTFNFPFIGLEHADTMRQSEISELLIAAINSNNLAPGSTIATYNSYGYSNVNTAIFRIPPVLSEGRAYPCDVDVPFEVFAHSGGIDPFDNAGDEASEQSRRELFERIAVEASFLFFAQQRYWLLMLLVIGRKFRCLAWNRMGVMVTPAVDYYLRADKLCDVLWRISQLNNAALGHDPRAIRPCQGDAAWASSCMDFVVPEDLPDVWEEGYVLPPIEELLLRPHGERVFEAYDINDPAPFEAVFGIAGAHDQQPATVPVPTGEGTPESIVNGPSPRRFR